LSFNFNNNIFTFRFYIHSTLFYGSICIIIVPLFSYNIFLLYFYNAYWPFIFYIFPIFKKWKYDLIMLDADSMNLHDVMVKLYKISITMTIISMKFVLRSVLLTLQALYEIIVNMFFLEMYELNYFILLTLLVVSCTCVL